MKKITKYIVIVLMLIILTGCTNYKEIIETESSKVEEQVQNINDISTDLIKESFNYIKDNIDKINKVDIYTKVVYYNKYLESLTKDNQNNELYKLTELVNKVLEDNTKDNRKEVKNYISKIESKIDDLSNDVYTYYYHNNIVNLKIEELKSQAIGDADDKNMVNTTQIKKAITYIENHLDNPYENEEILDKIIYYCLYLNELSDDESETIIQISNDTLEYLSTLDSNKKQNITRNINTLDNNDYLLFYNKVK